MNRAHILIVDDNEDYALSVRTILQSAYPNISVTVALTAADGIAQFKRESFDCVILDLKLPCGEGPELFERVLQAANKIPIVVVTAYTDPELEEALTRLGAQEIMDKLSTSPEDLIRYVKHAVDRHRVRTERLEAIQRVIAEAKEATATNPTSS